MYGCNADCDEMCSFQCAVCRIWTLHGSSFGVPSLTPTSSLITACTGKKCAVDRFIDIISRLDGLIEIMPRVNRELVVSAKPMRVCRLSFTNRYSFTNAALRLKTLRRLVSRLVQRLDGANNDELLLYVLRSTYAIDKGSGKPVTEMSVFQIQGDALRGFSNDAYTNIFDETATIYVKTELASPNHHPLPNTLLNIFADISKEYLYPMTISVIPYNNPRMIGINFDIQSDGKIITVHQDMLAVTVYNLLHCRKDSHLCLATVRIHRYGEQHKSDFVVFAFDRNTYNRVDRDKAEDIWNADYDNLKNSISIEQFC